VRNTYGINAWDRVLARWSAAMPEEPGPSGAITFDSLDGRRVFSLQAASAGSSDAPAGGWVAFRYRQGHPASEPHAPTTPYLLVVRVVADGDDGAEFRRWLGEEHGPRQTTLPGVHWLQAYEEEGPGHSFLNLWGIDDPAVIDSDAWVRVRMSPWWDRVSHVPAGADRGVYRRRERSGEG
jgi:hypothetical protein